MPNSIFKGQAFINGFNLGRYWPVRGPQVTLYVPAPALKLYPAKNSLLLFELDHAPCKEDDMSRRGIRNNYSVWKSSEGNDEKKCSVQFVDTPVLNGKSVSFISKSKL